MIYAAYVLYRYSDEENEPIEWSDGGLEKHYFKSYQEALIFKEKMLKNIDVENIEIVEE